MKYCQLVEEKENSYRLNQQRNFDKRHRAKELLALLSNVKLKEEEHLLWLPVKPGTAYRYLCGKQRRLILLGTLFGKKFLKNSSF